MCLCECLCKCIYVCVCVCVCMCVSFTLEHKPSTYGTENIWKSGNMTLEKTSSKLISNRLGSLVLPSENRMIYCFSPLTSTCNLFHIEEKVTKTNKRPPT